MYPPPSSHTSIYIHTTVLATGLQKANTVESTHSFRNSMILSLSLSLTSKAYSPSLKIKRQVQTQATVLQSFNFKSRLLLPAISCTLLLSEISCTKNCCCLRYPVQKYLLKHLTYRCMYTHTQNKSINTNSQCRQLRHIFSAKFIPCTDITVNTEEEKISMQVYSLTVNNSIALSKTKQVNQFHKTQERKPTTKR